MLHINRTYILIIAGNVLGYFLGHKNVIPFSVDLSNFCRTFEVESNTTIKIYKGHDVLFIDEMHNIIEKKQSFRNFDHNMIIDHLLYSKYIDSQALKDHKERYGLYCSCTSLPAREKLFNSDNVERSILIVSMY